MRPGNLIPISSSRQKTGHNQQQLAITIALQLFPSSPGEAAPPVPTAEVTAIEQALDCGKLDISFNWRNVSKTMRFELDVTKVGQNTVTAPVNLPHPFRNRSQTIGLFPAAFVGGINDGDVFQIDEIRLRDRNGLLLFQASPPAGGGPTAISCPNGS